VLEALGLLMHLVPGDAEDVGEETLDQAVAADPVPVFRRKLVVEGAATEAQLASIEANVNREVAQAQEYALASAWPEVAELETDVLGPAVKPPPITATEVLWSPARGGVAIGGRAVTA